MNKKGHKKLIVIFLVMALMISVSFFAINNESFNIGTLFPNIQLPFVSAQLTYNNVTLVDSTVYNPTTNICTASRFGMNITINPCVATDVDGRNIEQKVKFEWNGATAKNISWIFVYDNDLESGSISALVNQTSTVQQYVNTFVNNFLVDKVVSFTNLTYVPPYCDLGNLNNTRFYNVTRTSTNTTTYNQTVCFTNITTVNATAFRISGNADILTDVNIVEKRYVDVTNQIQYLGKGLLNDSRSYYKVNGILFNPSDTIDTKWVYTPVNKTKTGKWHILGYETSTGLNSAVSLGQYLYVDPWWNGTWTKRLQINISGAKGVALTNFTVYLNTSYDSDMQTDFDDIRFVEGDCATGTLEIPYEFDYRVNGSYAGFWVKVPNLNSGNLNDTVCMYYGNPSASSVSNGATAFDDNYTIVLHMSEDSGSYLKNSKDGNTTFMLLTGSPNWIDGKFGKALNLSTSGGNKYAQSSGASTVPSITANFTAEQWIYAYGGTGSRIHLSKLTSRGTSNFGFTMGQGGTYTSSGCYWGSSSYNLKYAAGITDTVGAWQGDTCVFRDVNAGYGTSNPTIVRNGVNFAGTIEGGAASNTLYQGDWAIGYFQGTNTWGNSSYDEIKISNILRTSDWLNRSYQNFNTSLFTLGAEESDNPPTFNTQVTTPANNTAYVLGASYAFNVTIEYTNGSAGLSFNGINTTMTNKTNNYTASVSNLGAGTYPYYFWAYGNGSQNSYNQTTLTYYTVAKGTSSIATFINNTRGTYTIGNNTNVLLNATLLTGVGNITLYVNNTIINFGNSTISNTTLFNFVTNYTILANYSGNTNYTSASESWTLIVTATDIPTITTLTISPASPIIYETYSNFTCSNNAGLPTTLYINGVNKTSEDGKLVLRGANTYTVNCTTLSTGFYLGNSTQQSYLINKQMSNNTMNMTINGVIANSSLYNASSFFYYYYNYGTQTNVSAYCPTRFNCQLWRDGSSLPTNEDVQTLNAATYLYQILALDLSSSDQNYSYNAPIYTYLTIEKSTPNITLTINPSTSVENSTVTTATCTASVGTANLTRNGVQVSNPDVSALGVGNYSYNCSVPSSTNYNANSTNQTLSVLSIVFSGANGNVNFTSSELIKKLYFQVPYNFVTRSYMNLSGSGTNTSSCTQEQANVSNACGGLSTGNYRITDTLGGGTTDWTNPARTTDNDWSTFGSYSLGGNTGYLFINYTKPSNVYGAVLNIKDNDGNSNVTIPSTCFNNDTTKISLRIDSINTPQDVRINCLNSSGYSSIALHSAGADIYEESITWNITSYPTNVNVSVNGLNQIFYHPNQFNQTNNRTQNFYRTINQYLFNCTYVGSYCIVPMNFSSSTAGVLTYNDLIIDNYGFIENSLSYSNTTIETLQQNYTLNMSYDSSVYSASASLVYNNTLYPATITTSGYNATINVSLLTPIGIGVKNFYWQVALTNSTSTNYFNSSIANTTVTLLNMSLCSNPYTVQFLNYTFRNESIGSEIINATFSADFTYWLSNSNVNKTFSYGNSTELRQYSFCFTPPSSYVYVGAVGSYDNAVSQQRSFVNDSMYLTNVSTNKDLLLLSDSNGIYITFIVQNTYGQRLSGALVDVKKTSGNVPIGQGYTDGTGIVAFFLNTGTSYTITTSASGYITSATGINPATSPVTITLSPESTGGGGTPSSSNGVRIRITPSGNELTNKTTYTFTFNISSTVTTLDEYGFALWNKTSALTSIVTGSNTNGSTLSTSFNTGNQSYIIMRYYYVMDGTTTNGTHTWYSVNTDGTDFSILHAAQNLNDDLSSSNGIFGVKKGDASGDFTIAIIIFAIVMIGAGAMTYKYGITSLTAVSVLIFGIILFLDVGAGLMDTINPVGAVPHFITIFAAFMLVGMFVKESMT